MIKGRNKKKKNSLSLFKRKNKFYLKNIEEVSHLIELILCSTILLSPLFMVLSRVGFYSIDPLFLKVLFGLSFLLSVLSIILNGIKNEKCTRLSAYYQIWFCSLFVGTLASQGDVSIYITYGLIPFLSCMYYSQKTVLVNSIFGYVTMISSLIVRSKHEIWMEPISGVIYTRKEWLLSAIVFFSIEYFISFLVAMTIEKHLKTNYDQLQKEQEKADEVKYRLQDESNMVFAANDELIKNTYHLFEIQDKIILFIGEVLGSHDLFTGNHILHTQVYVGIIARDLRDHGFYQDVLTDEEIRYYEMAAFLHDIGKVHIPESILNSTSRFTPEEFELMKTHTTEGKKLLKFLPQIGDGRFNEIAIEMAYCHHEKWDGTGYPSNIIGLEIPLSARIMAAADVLDALISQRLYKSPMTLDDAMKIFAESSGTHFEPCIAESVMRCKSQIAAVDQQFKAEESEKNANELEWWMNYHRKLNEIGLKE
ncbi:MAG: HD domain-containing protein [Treponemataceae bacterium]|nr:HD domain-containing protein [Spirochaetales bacterium]MDY6030674.1 HD domain-containing protein [Treponemataceae bacterium]